MQRISMVFGVPSDAVFHFKQWMSWILNKFNLLLGKNLWFWSRFSIWVIDNADHSLDILCVCTLMVNSFIGVMKRDRRDPSNFQIFALHICVTTTLFIILLNHQLCVNKYLWFCVEIQFQFRSISTHNV